MRASVLRLSALICEAMTTTPVERLDALIEDARLNRALEWRDFADQIGVSYETLRALRKTGKANDLSKRRVENALGWKAGSVDAVLAGGEPTPIGNGDNPPEPDSDEVQQLRAEIEELRAEIKRLSDRKRRRASEKDTPDLADTDG